MDGKRTFPNRLPGLTPDVFTYNSMLAAYGKAMNEEKIQEAWQEMLLCGVQPNVATYQNAIEAYSRYVCLPW